MGKYESGQTAGKPVGLGDLNANEQAVLLAAHANGGELPLGALAVAAFPELDTAKANSWTRNALRRLVRSGFIRHAQTGTYAAAPSLGAQLASQGLREAESAYSDAQRASRALDDEIAVTKARLASLLAQRQTANGVLARAWKAIVAARKAARS